MGLYLDRNIIIKDFVEKGILVNTELSLYQRVNKTGLLIARLLERAPGITLNQVITEVAEYYNIPEKLIKDDVSQYISNLVKEEFIHEDINQIAVPTEDIEEIGNGVWIQVTNGCNLRCKYCYANSSSSEDDITLDEIKSLLDELKKKNFNKIVITGGEPLVRKDILEIIELCSGYGRVQLLTNGTLGDRALYQKIMDSVEIIQISLDSYSEEIHDSNRGEGTFHKAIGTLEMLSGINSAKIAVAMTPTPEYMADLTEMIKMCLSLNIVNIHVNRFVPYGRARKSYTDMLNMKEFYKWADEGYAFLFQKYIEAKKQNKIFNFNLDIVSDLRLNVFSRSRKCSCGINENILSIAYDGSVFLCPSLHNNKLKLGSIREDTILSIIDQAKEKLGEINVNTLPKCSKCELKYYCGGGCRAMALHSENDFYGKDIYCEDYMERIYSLMLGA